MINPLRLNGVRLILYLGDEKASPAPPFLVEALRDVEVELGDEGNDGFQMTFSAGRKAGVVTADSPVFEHPLLAPFSRVVLHVLIGAQMEPLIDGFITHREASPGDLPGEATLTVTGEDVRVMMDIEERTVSHSGLSVEARVERILASYQRYFGGPPEVRAPRNSRTPSPLERIPLQTGTDLAYVRRLADESAYVFFVEPMAVANANRVYWGPPRKSYPPQPALNVNMGPDSNAAIRFTYDALKPEAFEGSALDSRSRQLQPVTAALGAGPSLALRKARDFQRGVVRKTLARRGLGLSVLDVIDSGNAAAARSEDALTATAKIDVAAYGDVLRPRRLVGVRGAGRQLDGLYYVKRVTHALRRGGYTQNCSLAREGIGRLGEAMPT